MHASLCRNNLNCSQSRMFGGRGETSHTAYFEPVELDTLGEQSALIRTMPLMGWLDYCATHIIFLGMHTKMHTFIVLDLQQWTGQVNLKLSSYLATCRNSAILGGQKSCHAMSEAVTSLPRPFVEELVPYCPKRFNFIDHILRLLHGPPGPDAQLPVGSRFGEPSQTLQHLHRYFPNQRPRLKSPLIQDAEFTMMYHDFVREIVRSALDLHYCLGAFVIPVYL